MSVENQVSYNRGRECALKAIVEVSGFISALELL